MKDDGLSWIIKAYLNHPMLRRAKVQSMQVAILDKHVSHPNKKGTVSHVPESCFCSNNSVPGRHQEITYYQILVLNMNVHQEVNYYSNALADVTRRLIGQC